MDMDLVSKFLTFWILYLWFHFLPMGLVYELCLIFFVWFLIFIYLQYLQNTELSFPRKSTMASTIGVPFQDQNFNVQYSGITPVLCLLTGCFLDSLLPLKLFDMGNF